MGVLSSLGVLLLYPQILYFGFPKHLRAITIEIFTPNLCLQVSDSPRLSVHTVQTQKRVVCGHNFSKTFVPPFQFSCLTNCQGKLSGGPLRLRGRGGSLRSGLSLICMCSNAEELFCNTHQFLWAPGLTWYPPSP